MERNAIASVDVTRCKYVAPVFKSYTKAAALRALSKFFANVYTHDLDTDRSQVSETRYRLCTYHKDGSVQETVEFSNRELVDNFNTLQSLKDIIIARRP